MVGFIVLIAGLFILAQIISGSLFAFYVNFTHALEGIELTMGEYRELIEENMIYIAILSGVLSLLFFWLLFLIRRLVTINKEGLLEYCKFKKLSFPQLVMTALMGISFYFILAGVMFFTELPRYFPEHQQLLEPMFAQHFLVSLIGLGLIASFVEEIGFRGIIFNRMFEDIPVMAAVFLQAVFFGFIHFNVLQSSYAFILGLLIGFLYLWTGSIWAPIVAHFTFNSSSVLMEQVIEIEKTPTDVGILMTVGAMVLVVSIVYFLNTSHHEQNINAAI